ncbi:MAG TPA: hypothetical protein VMR52_10725 [Dehalococcoidia bacterium]|nr:hypothetical protein [Dehalococcoidia bacterium]
MAFFTIFVSDGLSDRDYRRALDAGPTFVSTQRRDHQEMIRAAGFTNVREIDLTKEFATTSRAWLEQRWKYESELIATEGEAGFRERQDDYERQTAAAEDGLLKRALFVCS